MGIVWTRHAQVRAQERRIAEKDIESMVRLFGDQVGTRGKDIVYDGVGAAVQRDGEHLVVITVFRPDPLHPPKHIQIQKEKERNDSRKMRRLNRRAIRARLARN
jgi:N6-adenosine-specific RNA methylase IME4